ncbi:hypothetical protein XU18_0114 [Perkinsela sp. CCAP 1560/4]|nr:hypothetical protein XU18_0114 [Perkinsela sp. CCAP 1560/4]|eukprot:KNH09429.1 hypothetical protein XU18_0114 [Perkinsela sp. CCAP 1560/4]
MSSKLPECRFLFYGNTIVACQDTQVVGYYIGETKNWDSFLHFDDFSSVQVAFTVLSPKDSEDESRKISPVALIEKITEQRIIIVWDSGIVQEINSADGVVMESHVLSLLSPGKRVIHAKTWCEDKLLILVAERKLHTSVDAIVWGKKDQTIHTWTSICSQDVEVLRIQKRLEGKHSEYTPSGIVYIAQDRKGIEWFGTDHTCDKRRFEIPLDKSAELKLIRAHPHQSGTIALTDNIGHLYIVKGINLSLLDVGTRYSSKRWHSREILCLQWSSDIDSFDLDTLYTGGSEGALCVWAASTLKVNVIPRFPGSITGISASTNDPSKIVILLDNSSLILVDLALKKAIAGYPYLAIRNRDMNFSKVKPVQFMGKSCFCLFGGSQHLIQFVEQSSTQLLCSIPTLIHQNRVVTANADQVEKNIRRTTAVEIINQFPVDYIAVYESIPICSLNTLSKSTLRFFQFDSAGQIFAAGTVIHDPHPGNTCDVPLYIRDKADSSIEEGIPMILCSHPTLPILLSGVANECKLWTVKKDDTTHGVAHAEWYCFAVHFEGLYCAQFTGDGTALGIWHTLNQFISIYDTQAIADGGTWSTLRRIHVNSQVPHSLKVRQISFFNDDKSLLISDASGIYSADLLQKCNEAPIILQHEDSASCKMMRAYGSGFLVVLKDNILNIYEVQTKMSEKSLHVECVFTCDLLDSEIGVTQVVDVVVAFDGARTGQIALIDYAMQQTNSGDNTALTNFPAYFTFCLDKPGLQKLNYSNLPVSKEKIHSTKNALAGMLPLLDNPQKSAFSSGTQRISRFEKIDIDGSLCIPSYKLPPLSFVMKKLWGLE